MDWSDNEEQQDFREKVRSLIAERLPARYRSGGVNAHRLERTWEFDRKSEDPDRREAAVAWSDALAEHNWVAPHWPEEYGGGGLSSMEQFILKQELASSGAPAVGGSGTNMLGPTLIINGTEEQRREHLPRILSGEVTWAQGFSEPGAGSDLASLSTSARRDGDDYVINGQKIWTSAAHTADWFFLLTRTDPAAPKHRGISFLLVDGKTPGIGVQPLVDMSDVHYFNETFYEEVRTPVSNIVGEENRGWYVAMNLLDFERSNIEGAVSMQRGIEKLLSYCASEEGRGEVAARARRDAAHRGRRPLHRDGRDVPVLGAGDLDPGGGDGAELRGLDLEALQLGAAAAALGDEHQDVRAVRAALGSGHGGRAGERVRRAGRRAAVQLPARRPRDDPRRHLRGAAQHHCHPRPRPASGVGGSASCRRRGRARRGRSARCLAAPRGCTR